MVNFERTGGKGMEEWQHISIRVMIQGRGGRMKKKKKPDSIFEWSVRWTCVVQRKGKENCAGPVHRFHSAYPLAASGGYQEERETNADR